MPIVHDESSVPRIIYFTGILANTDSSILSVGLDHDFTIRSLSDRKASECISQIENLPLPDSRWQLLWDFSCINPDENKCYYVGNSFEVEDTSESAIHAAVKEFNYGVVHDYLEQAIRLMRLYKKGNICMPLRYYYYLDREGRPRSCGGGNGRYPVPREPFTLQYHEIEEIEEFMKKNSLQSREPYISLAMDFFDQSYRSGMRSISFSLLMSCLGTLFYPTGRDHDWEDIPSQISRNIAVLLGRNREKARNIRKDVEKLLHRNVKLMKCGNGKIISKLDVVKARAYVRESIKEAMDIGLSKEGLMKMLGSCGFAERPWKAD